MKNLIKNECVDHWSDIGNTSNIYDDIIGPLQDVLNPKPVFKV